jgi:hypothetical protein
MDVGIIVIATVNIGILVNLEIIEEVYYTRKLRQKKKMPFINKTPSHVSFAVMLHISNLLK